MANPATALDGQQFGRLTVLHRAPNTVQNKAAWLCECQCGTQKIVTAAHLRNGTTTSCGCLAREGVARLDHGHARTNHRHPLYATWRGIKVRCSRPDSKDWARYGGRGIRMCDRWLRSFPAFLADVGEKPGPEYSIDRIDNDGHYEPSNVRWATPSQQRTNQRPRTAVA
jgi:hypothetical protein